MTTYLEILQKIEARTLDNIKQMQAVQLATLTAAREIVDQLPAAKGMPTFAQVADVATSFASQVLDQQKAVAAQLADVFMPAAKSTSGVPANSN